MTTFGLSCRRSNLLADQPADERSWRPSSPRARERLTHFGAHAREIRRPRGQQLAPSLELDGSVRRVRPLFRGHAHALAGPREQAENLGRSTTGASEPVWLGCIELCDLSGLDNCVVFTDDEPHPATEHVDSFVTFVHPRAGHGL